MAIISAADKDTDSGIESSKANTPIDSEDTVKNKMPAEFALTSSDSDDLVSIT